ncbi:dynein light intermediate chain [Rhizopus microsporus]|nr:dynein light intermediate chain [Rhizopus microsporus]
MTVDESAPVNNNIKSHYTQNIKTPIDSQEKRNDLALGYSFIDVKDEENEAVARLGCYQLGLSSPEFLPLLKFAIRSETVADACVLILLDWTRPWKFMETLMRWINVTNYLVDEICKENTNGAWSQGKAMMDELRETLEHYLQTYTEPSSGMILTASTSTSSIATTNTTLTNLNTAVSNHADQVVLPLTQGCLTTNLGIPIIVVCCKSDAMNVLEQTHDYNEDQFDFIQQCLRCICMKYGAALFYTSSYQPHTYHHLREYMLHRLLSNNNKTYPFNVKAQVIERETVLVPSGWDSWGKIKVLREGFDCESLSESWDENMDALADGHQPANTSGALGIYEEAIPNDDLGNQPQHISAVTVCEDEQVFYERHFETLQKTNDNMRKNSSKPGLVGPIGVTSAAIDLTRIDTNKNEFGLDKSLLKSITSTNGTSTNGSTTPTSTVASNTIPSPVAAATAQNGPSHEIIANFFQSLLTKKGPSGGAASPTASPLLSGLPQSNGREESHRRPTISRKDVHKELDRMRQYT